MNSQSEGGRSRRNVQRAADELSEMLVQSVRELGRARKQKRRAARAAGSGESEGCDTRAMKEMTAILKDLAAVAKTLEDDTAQGNTATGVVLLPTVDGTGEENTENA